MPPTRARCRNAIFLNYSGWTESIDGCSIISFDEHAQWAYDWVQDMDPIAQG